MSPKILRRCSLCKQFHASYLVPDSEFGKIYLCYDCWKARQAPQLPPDQAVRRALTHPKRHR